MATVHACLVSLLSLQDMWCLVVKYIKIQDMMLVTQDHVAAVSTLCDQYMNLALGLQPEECGHRFVGTHMQPESRTGDDEH